AVAVGVKVDRHGPTDRQATDELVAFAGGRQIPELHAVIAHRGHEPSPRADGDPTRWVFVAKEGAALATGGHLPAIIQPLVVRSKVMLRVPPIRGHAEERLPGHGVPEPIGRIPTLTREEVAAVVEGETDHRPKVP